MSVQKFRSWILIAFILVKVDFSTVAQAQNFCAQSHATVSVQQRQVDQFFQNISPGWRLPKKGTQEYQKIKSLMPSSMSRELDDSGYWQRNAFQNPRLPVPVARFHEAQVNSMRTPRNHMPLPSIAKDGSLVYPDHIRTDEKGNPIPTENFFVRMMAIKNRGSDEFTLPLQLEYLRPFIAESFRLEKERDPQRFKNRYAFVQVDASWVEAHQNQPRPGKTTTQNADRANRQGAHVDGFLLERFWDQQEDMTYSVSFGYDPVHPDRPGDNIPTEFFDTSFAIPEGLTHPEARVKFDEIANAHPDSVVLFPPGVINRMGARVVHRVGVAKERTYRTFIKVKFTDEIFHQVENTMNVDSNLRPASFYQTWNSWNVPLVDRKTLPTEGTVMPEDADKVHQSGGWLAGKVR